jgi:hypothetical protein
VKSATLTWVLFSAVSESFISRTVCNGAVQQYIRNTETSSDYDHLNKKLPAI